MRPSKQMYVKGGRGGLKQLTVPTRNEAERHRSTTEFLENVMKFCPNVEYLDGPEQVFHGYDGVRCDDKWMMSLDTWEQFSKTCTSLRKFHWAAMPFADPFFSAFGAYPKMQLKELTLTANLLWTWKEYFKNCDHATATAIKNYHGKDAKNIGALFKGCPGLSRLIVEVDSQEYNPTPARLFTLDEYGDKFWGSVVTHCPLLRRLAIRNCSNFEEKTVKIIHTFTDATLFKLAELKYLGLTESNLAVMCTGDGIFDFMRLVIEKNCRTGNTFEIDLRIGGQQGSVPRFYSVVIALLRRLAAVSEKDFGAAARRQKFEVYLANPYKSKLNKQWSGSYMCDQLRPLLERVQKQHPSLKANAHITGQTGDSFSRIDLLTLIWSRDHFGNNLFINGPDDEDYEPPDLNLPRDTINLADYLFR